MRVVGDMLSCQPPQERENHLVVIKSAAAMAVF